IKSQHRVFNPGNRSLENLLHAQTRKYRIRLYDFALNWTHIHMVIKLQRRDDYHKFIRALTSLMAAGGRRRRGLEKVFSLRPFTKILSWGRQFQNALDYQILNQLEALSLIVRPKKKGPCCEDDG